MPASRWMASIPAPLLGAFSLCPIKPFASAMIHSAASDGLALVSVRPLRLLLSVGEGLSPRSFLSILIVIS